MDTLKEFVEKKRTFIAAHRGASGVAPENTFAAYNEALKAGADMIEVDVQMTIDKQIICYHDFRLGRTTHGKKPIGRLPWKYLRKLDVGSWYDKYFHRERIPTLEDVIELIRGKAYLNIELKSHKKEPNKERAERIYKIVKEMDYLPYTLFGSFDYKLMKIMREFDPDIHTAAISHPNSDLLPSQIKEEFGTEAFVCSLDEVNEEIDKDCKENGIYLGVYSIDNWYELEKIKKYNIKTIVSNFPGNINSIIHRYFPAA